MNKLFSGKELKTGRGRRILAMICVAAMMLTLIGSITLVNADESTEITYDTLLFDQSYVHTVNVEIAEEDWADLLANPTKETKYDTTITIDGEEYEHVSFKTKGNTSLSSVARLDSDRYSFKLNFGSVIEDQTYHGLKKLHLGNIYADATYLKDYISYEIFRAAGVDAPLASYVQLSINGEVFGLYLAIEDISGSYLDRTQEGKGELYKPANGIDDMNGADRDEDFERPEGESEGDSAGASEGDSHMEETEDAAQVPEAAEDAVPAEGESNGEPVAEAQEGGAEAAEGESDGESAAEAQEGGAEAPAGESNGESSGEREGDSEGDSAGGGFGGFGGFDSGASLSYIDDNVSSYSDIFDNAVTNVTEEDMQKVVDALKNLSEGNIEEAVDTDALMRYFAAHNFVINGDSYTGSMLHNYFLYERGGLLTMLPWDYNLAFGTFAGMGFDGSGATGTVNTGIDSLLTGGNESRPMWDWIVSDEQYLEQYHAIVDELISGYFESGEFEEEMARVYEMIRPYVESDPSAFFTVEEFDTAYQTLLDFCLLRAQSIRKQLNGELSTVTNDQDPESRVDASSVDVSATGGMNMGGGPGDSEGDSRGDSEGEAAESAGGESAGEAAESAEDAATGEAAESAEGESEDVAAEPVEESVNTESEEIPEDVQE